MNGQLSVTKLSVMIMLGGIVSVPMQVPDRGLLHGTLVLAYKYRRVERLTRGKVKMVLTDGILNLLAMAATNVSREQLFTKSSPKHRCNKR